MNLNAEVQVLALHAKLDRLREEQWAELVEFQRQQIGLLTRIEQRPQLDGMASSRHPDASQLPGPRLCD